MAHAGGRPTSYNPKYCEELVAHMAKGLSWHAFAGKLSVSRETLYEWARVHEEFSDARKIGISKNLEYWEEQGRLGLWQEEGAPKLNSAVWIFNMKARHHWRDKHEGEVKPETRELDKASNETLDNIIENENNS